MNIILYYLALCSNTADRFHLARQSRYASAAKYSGTDHKRTNFCVPVTDGNTVLLIFSWLD